MPPAGRRPRTFLARLSLAAVALALLCAGLAGCGGVDRASSQGQAAVAVPPIPPLPPGRFGPRRPNIVFVLTDDLSMNLLRFMPHVQAMQAHGLTFKNYFVSDSLCCPSRASIFTGRLPHDTHVFSNFGRYGGFRTFHARGEERQTFALALQRAGYATALMGKYLNGYMRGPRDAIDGAAGDVPRTYRPPGWTAWDVAGWGYPEFNYVLNENGVLQSYGRHRQDYLTDVLARDGTTFITRAAASHRPFFLELATFAPHRPYVPAPQDARSFPGLRAPRPKSFDVLPTHAPSWLAAHPPLTGEQIRRIDRVFRRRVQSVQAVDRMIGEIEQTLTAEGIANDTYLVFSSDNGLHTGEYRLMPGKLTAFDTDIHVPLVVVGPGVPAGRTTAAMAENIDLAETFAGIGHVRLRGDGRSLLPLLHGRAVRRWRTGVLVEHRGRNTLPTDPDYQQPASGSPLTYEAMRTRQFLYVEYDDGEREFYNLKTDPYELHNIVWRLPSRLLERLHRELEAMVQCHGRDCWRAMHVPRLLRR